MHRIGFEESCDYLLDQIVVEMVEADVTDKNQIKILTDNTRYLKEAKKYDKGRIRKWLSQLSLSDILKMVFTVYMFHYILDREDEGKICTSRAKDWIFFNRAIR